MVLTLQSSDKLDSRENLHVNNIKHFNQKTWALLNNCKFLPGKYLKLLPEVRTGPGTSISASSWNFLAKTFNKIWLLRPVPSHALWEDFWFIIQDQGGHKEMSSILADQ